MSRGRKKTPTPILVMKGNPGQRPINEREPRAKAGPNDPPIFLDEIAQDEWRRLVPDLLRNGIFKTFDVSALAAYCDSYSQFVRACQYMQTLPPDVAAADRRAAQIAVNDAKRIMHVFSSEFGFTPSSRTKLQITNESSVMDELEQAIRTQK